MEEHHVASESNSVCILSHDLPPTPNSRDAHSSDRNESPGRSDSGTEEVLVNPPPPAELGEEECAVLRGDAIGNTAYTERWVLNTLLVITQALPYYLTVEIEPTATSESTQDDTESKTMDTEDPGGEVNVNGASIEDRTSVVELGEDVESAACQLWDLTVEPDVVNHLLNLEAIDILQLATDIVTLSRAPRLTEVVVGVVANICCQKEGCQRIVNHQALINACLALPQTTDDVPTLIEVFRFLRLVLWHLSHRIPKNDRVGCPLVLAFKSNEALKVSLVFILKNSLNETLLKSVVEFIEVLVYLWLPDDQCYMAAHYSESGLVEGVVEVMRHFLKQYDKKGEQELPEEVHRGILILYSFVGIPAHHLISSFDQYESLLEPILLCYIEHIAKSENIEELLEESAERLIYALGLYELLVPTMRHPNILSSIGRLLVLTHKASQRYSTPQGKHLEATPKCTFDHRSRRKLRRSKSRRSRSSQEQMETETLPDFGQESKDKVKEGPGITMHRLGLRRDSSERSRKNFESSEMQSSNSKDNNKACCLLTESCRAVAVAKDHPPSERVGDMQVQKDDNKDTNQSAKLNSIIESLIDYCVRVVKYSRDLFTVLSSLNECHVQEVQLFFRAVRSREPKLVGDLQEKLLDTGSHNRLVTILADMYT